MKLTNALLITTALAIAAGSYHQAMALPPPPAAPLTLWNFLGIPQGFNKIRDATSNKFGKHPGLERKPPLKALADPSNLMSPNPAIKAAADIKTQEDMAPQKIKAIKYLATIGCGCYPGVKDALMAALEDCTEEVRYQAALAIEDAANLHCATCSKNCCCDQAMRDKLSKIAYERDDKCCWFEASERVREAAKAALCACMPEQGPAPTQAQPEPDNVPEGAPTPPVPEGEPSARHHRRNMPTVIRVPQLQETRTEGSSNREAAMVADERANVTVVPVDFGSLAPQAPRLSSPVSPPRRTAPAKAIPTAMRSTAPASNSQDTTASTAQPWSPSTATPLGPSSRRAAAARGLGASPTVSKNTPPAKPGKPANATRTADTKQPANSISGWFWQSSNN